MWGDVPLAKSSWLACACREYVNTRSKLSPFDIYMLQPGSRTHSGNKDTAALVAAPQKPPWCCRLRKVRIGRPWDGGGMQACVQPFPRPPWPPVIGWLWNSFKNVVFFYLFLFFRSHMVRDFACWQHACPRLTPPTLITHYWLKLSSARPHRNNTERC